MSNSSRRFESEERQEEFSADIVLLEDEKESREFDGKRWE
jgi:hypothetical protein